MPALLFTDAFDNGAFSTSSWPLIDGANLDVFTRLNPPSPAYSVRLNGSPSGGDRLESRVIDLTGEAGVTLSYFYQRKGGGDAPEAGDDLIVEYRSAGGSWVELERQLGSGPAMATFLQRNVSFPAAALHGQFQFRFRSISTENGDDWFVDSINLGTTTGFTTYWSLNSEPTGVFHYPTVFTITNPNTPTPTGGGSLSFTAAADLGDPNEFLAIAADGIPLGNIFVDDGRDFSLIQTTIPISRSLLETLAADGSIQITITPSPGVSDVASTRLDVRFEYAIGTANPAPVLDLNGPAGAGSVFATAYAPGSGPVSIVPSDLTLTDVAGAPPASMQGVYVGGFVPPGNPAVYRLDPSDPPNPQLITSGRFLRQPRDIAVTAAGDLLVGEFGFAYSSQNTLIRIHPLSRSQELFTVGLNVANSVAANRRTGAIYVQDNVQTYRVNPVTGALTFLASHGTVAPGSMSVDPVSGYIYYGGNNRTVNRIHPVTGIVETLASSGFLGNFVEGTAVEASGHVVAVSGTNVVRIHPTTGAQSLVSSGQLLSAARDIHVLANGDLLVQDDFNEIFRVDPVTGAQSLFINDSRLSSSNGIAGLQNPAPGTEQLLSATVTITNRLDGAAEVLAANTAGTAITATYDSANGVLRLTGADTIANYQQVLRTVTYNNTATTPNLTARQIRFVVSDGLTDSVPATSFVTLGAGLIVTSFTPTSSGFTAQFSQALAVGDLNLYDGPAGNLGPADVVILGSATGPLRGSLVVNAGNSVTFLQTGGVLPPDTYTVTLRSAANGFHTASGGLLDGNADGASGDNFTATFTVPPTSEVAVRVPDFMRGPGQPVDVPGGSTGLPLQLSNGDGVREVSLTLLYNPVLLTLTSIERGPSTPTNAVVTLITSTPGQAVITFTSSTPLSAGPIDFAILTASVPGTATYTSKQVLDITNPRINNGSLSALDDDGLHVVGYFGDTTGNGTYSSLDANRVAQVAVGLATGFERYQLADPRIIADITGNGLLNSTDALRILQEATGVDRPEIPPLPAMAPPLVQGGPDPLLQFPKRFRARPGQTITVPLLLDPSDELVSVDLAISYDWQRLELVKVQRGELTSDFDLFLANLESEKGTIRIGMSRSAGPISGRGKGSVLTITYRVKADAPSGRAILNLRENVDATFTALNEGGLDLIPDPSNEAGDVLDGAITVAPPQRRLAARDLIFALNQPKRYRSPAELNGARFS